MIWCEKVTQNGLKQKINNGLLSQAQQKWRSTLLECQKAGHSCSFFIRSRISGHGSSSSRGIVPETLSAGFQNPAETSNSNWGGQPELYQIVPKPSHAQEEQTHFWDKKEDGTISIHFVPTGKVAADSFTKFLPLSKVEIFRTVLMGTDAVKSSLSGTVRISIKLWS